MLTYRTSREHGCSQSFESSSARGNLVLELAESGEVRVHVTVDRSSTFGPSIGRFRAGERDFSHRHEAEDRSWKGSAERDGEGFSVKLEQVESSCQALPAYGTEGGVPTRCLQEEAVLLRCTPVTVDVLKVAPADDRPTAEDAETEAVEALRCGPWLGVYPSSSPALHDGVPLGRAPGLELREDDGMIGRHQVAIWRAALAPSERPR